MIHVSVPAGTPQWIIALSLVGAVLIGLCYVLVRLVRAALPETSVERRIWWEDYWNYRRDLRRERYRRRDRRHTQRRSRKPDERHTPQPRGRQPCPVQQDEQAASVRPQRAELVAEPAVPHQRRSSAVNRSGAERDKRNTRRPADNTQKRNPDSLNDQIQP
jgi:hypothetical protein